MAEASGPSLRLPRSRRLSSSRDYLRLKAKGRRAVQGCLIANWLPVATGGPSRLGLIASRKVGGAVVRNRARRLLREAFRLHQNELKQPVDMVLIARPSIAHRPFREVERDFVALLRAANLAAVAERT